MQKYIIACKPEEINSYFSFFSKKIAYGHLRAANYRRGEQMDYRTDLAMEAYTLWKKDAGETTELPGVMAREEDADGVHITRVEILDDRGARALGKPVGRYVTLELTALSRREAGSFEAAAEAISREAAAFLHSPESVLCAGLGNDALSPDAFGPWTLGNLLVTRHLKAHMPEAFSGFCSVSCVKPGVLGTSGMEALELVRAAADFIKPEAVIVFDALAAAEPERLCTTVQLTDAGLAPGSGLGNHRAAFCEESLGRPVLAVGAPTLMRAERLAGRELPGLSGLIVTPRDIDLRVREIARAVGYGLSLALHPGLTVRDLAGFLA